MNTVTLTRRAALALAAQGGLAFALAGCGNKGGGEANPGAATDTTPAAGNVTQAAVTRPSLVSQASLDPEPEVSAEAPSYTIEPGLANVSIPEDAYVTDDERAKLEELGFAVRGNGWGDEFYPLYEENRYWQHANFVTVDSLMHTYHLYFQYLLKNLERGELSTQLGELSALLLQAAISQRGELAGTEWDAAARRNLVFFGVASQLLDPSASIPGSVAADVAEEVDRVLAAAGIEKSLVTGEDVDYTQFAPRGYYAGDEALERYFRTMMWYGQLSFYQRVEELDRCALLMCLALEGDTLAAWKAIYTVTSFFAGASDDCGYYEYRPAVEEAYGTDVSCASLPGNDDAWASYRSLTAQMPAPQINSLPGGNAQDLGQNTCFRLMGQRFSIDAALFQQLVYSNVLDRSDGARRMLPDALDIPAAFGSNEALAILEEQGDTSYPHYADNMDELRAKTDALTDTFWEASLYNQWLATLMPLLSPKGEGYPLFMRSSAWTRHALETFLGSYTELKHDTVLYSKQVLAEGDGLFPENEDDRGYVEPEPLVFARLRRLSAATAQGLEQFGMITSEDKDDLGILESLAGQLGTIAAKELVGTLPTDDEFELIRSIGVQLEHFWERTMKEEAERLGVLLDPREMPAALVVDVATGGGSCLELACGNVRTMLVVVPVDGSLRLASGPVYSFYQFEQPASERLTDQAWRDLLRNSWQSPSDKTAAPSWTDPYCVYYTYG